MYTKQEIIIRSYREGKSQRQISRELQISRKTVRKYLREHEEVLRSAESEEAGQTRNLSSAPIYKKTIPRTKIKLTREVESAIEELLEKNEQKKQQGLGKHRGTGGFCGYGISRQFPLSAPQLHRIVKRLAVKRHL